MKINNKQLKDLMKYFSPKYKIINPDGCFDFVPRGYQQELIERFSTYKYNSVFCARQMGTSSTMLVKALDDLENGGNTVIITPRNFIQENIISNNQNIKYKKESSLYSIDKNYIKHFSSRQAIQSDCNCLRGLDIDHVIIDQAAFISNSHIEKILDFMASFYKNAKVTLISSMPIDCKNNYALDIMDSDKYKKSYLRWFIHPTYDASLSKHRRIQYGNEFYRRNFELRRK